MWPGTKYPTDRCRSTARRLGTNVPHQSLSSHNVTILATNERQKLPSTICKLRYYPAIVHLESLQIVRQRPNDLSVSGKLTFLVRIQQEVCRMTIRLMQNANFHLIWPFKKMWVSYTHTDTSSAMCLKFLWPFSGRKSCIR